MEVLRRFFSLQLQKARKPFEADANNLARRQRDVNMATTILS
jgi:hypothetical protein